MFSTPEPTQPGHLTPSEAVDNSLDLDYLDRHIRERTPNDWDLMEKREAQARAAYDDLLKLGGRPTRPIREEFAYPTFQAFDDRRQYWYDEEGIQQYAERDQLMPHHWKTEWRMFQDQLDRWTEFREAQAVWKADGSLQQHLLLKPSRLLRPGKPLLTNNLIKIRDWRAYRTYQRTRLERYNHSRNARRRDFSSLKQACLSITHPTHLEDAEYDLERIAGYLDRSHEEWLAEKAKTDQIEGEMSKILEDAVNELNNAHDPVSLRNLENDILRTVRYLAKRLGELSGTSWSVRLPSDTSSTLDRLCHWEREVSRFADLYTDWKENLMWIQEKQDPMDDEANYVQAVKPNPVRNRKLWDLHVWYRQKCLDYAKLWETCWEEIESDCTDQQFKKIWLSKSLSYKDFARKERSAAQSVVQDATLALDVARAETSKALGRLDHLEHELQLPTCTWDTTSIWVDADIIRKRKADDDSPMTPPKKRIRLSQDRVSTEEMNFDVSLQQAHPSLTPTSYRGATEQSNESSPCLPYPTPPSTISPSSAQVDSNRQGRLFIAASVAPTPMVSTSVAALVAPIPVVAQAAQHGAPNCRGGRRAKNTDHQNLNKGAHVPGALRYNLRPRPSSPDSHTLKKATGAPPIEKEEATAISQHLRSTKNHKTKNFVRRSKPSNRSSHGREDGTSNRVQRSKPSNRSSHGREDGTSNRVQRSKPSNRSSHERESGVNKLDQRSKPSSRSSHGREMGAIENLQNDQAVDAPKLRRSIRIQKQKSRWSPY